MRGYQVRICEGLGVKFPGPARQPHVCSCAAKGYRFRVRKPLFRPRLTIQTPIFACHPTSPLSLNHRRRFLWGKFAKSTPCSGRAAFRPSTPHRAMPPAQFIAQGQPLQPPPVWHAGTPPPLLPPLAGSAMSESCRLRSALSQAGQVGADFGRADQLLEPVAACIAVVAVDRHGLSPLDDWKFPGCATRGSRCLRDPFAAPPPGLSNSLAALPRFAHPERSRDRNVPEGAHMQEVR